MRTRILVTLFVIALTTVASAAPVFEDTMSYTVGIDNLDGQGGWYQTRVKSFSVTAGSLAYTDGDGDYLVTAGEKAYHHLDTWGNRIEDVKDLDAATKALFDTTGTMYMAFLFRDEGSLSFRSNSHGGAISLQKNDAGASSNSVMQLADQNDASEINVYGPLSLDGETQLFAVRLVIDASALGVDTLTLLVDPDLSNPDWNAGVSASKDIGVPDKIIANSMHDREYRMAFDEIRIGATWADVAPYIPEPATLIVLAFGTGLALLRGRRK